ncbi:MAG: response regulator transcription factor [Oscillospiraceae bacterium]|nr:response regulator transcription factor [Oscillospiraceae bacterium]
MSANKIFTAKNEITGIKSRPNVIIAYGEGKREEAMSLSDMLSREEINVIPHEKGDIFENTCLFGDMHMMVVRDGGLSAPEFGLIEELRKMSDIPVLTVSDGCDEIYRTMALAKGADACMNADEFGRFEFKARVVSLLRRYLKNQDRAGGIISADGETLTNGSISIDRRRREVFRSGSLIRMTAIEYGIVEYLMENCGAVCTVDDIYRRVWNETPYSVRKTVVEHIRRIRSKIEPDPHNPSYIKVVFGVGYKMERAV